MQTKLDKALNHLAMAKYGLVNQQLHLDEAVKLVREVNDQTKNFMAFEQDNRLDRVMEAYHAKA